MDRGMQMGEDGRVEPVASTTIPLGSGLFATVDIDDAERLAGYKWRAHKVRNVFYAERSEGSSTVAMHRQVLQPPKGTVIDHINGDGLDNRRTNLRIVSHQENSFNRSANGNRASSFKGVSYDSDRLLRWHARIKKGGKTISLGRYATEIEAAKAYNDAAALHFGEFARPNTGVA